MEVYGWENHRTQWWFSSTPCSSTAGCMYGGLSRQVPQITQVIKQFLYDPCTHVPPWCKPRKMLSQKMAPGENFGGDRLTPRVMGIPQCEKLSHIHGWTYEPFGEPKENECTILPRIPLISNGCISCSFCISLSLIYIYILCCNWCGLLSQKDLGVAKGYGEETLFQSTPTTDFPAISHCCFLPLHFLDQSCCRTTMDAWGIRWFCCLYGHSAFQWPFLLQALQYEFKMRSCRLRFGRLGQGALPLPLPLAVRPRPVAVVSL